MKRLLVLVAAFALLACAVGAQESAVAEPRFAETEMEDAQALSEQQAAYEATLNMDAEEEEESEGADEEALEEEADEEGEEEEESDSDEDADSAEDQDSIQENEEGESEEAEGEEAEAASETEESAEDADAENSPDYVLAELSDHPVMTGFMEMMAKFVPTAHRTAEHLVHSLNSEQAALAQQEYLKGYAAGHSDGMMAAHHAMGSEEEEESDEEHAGQGEGEAESGEEEEASFVEGSAQAEAEAEAEAESETEAAAEGSPRPMYGWPHGYAPYGGYAYNGAYPGPAYAPYSARGYTMGFAPPPPPMPVWLPPPPYITPVADK